VDVRDIGMIQRRKRLRFADEPCEPVGVAREEIGQHLDRDITVKRQVSGTIDLAHAARSEGGDNLIRAEAGAVSEGQTVDYTGGPTGLLLSDPAVFSNRLARTNDRAPISWKWFVNSCPA
jgi:hypothetical protein